MYDYERGGEGKKFFFFKVHRACIDALSHFPSLYSFTRIIGNGRDSFLNKYRRANFRLEN